MLQCIVNEVLYLGLQSISFMHCLLKIHCCTMLTPALKQQDQEKQEFAAKSLSYNLEHPQLKQMFHQEQQAAKDRPSPPSSSSHPAQSSEGRPSTADASNAAQTQATGRGTQTTGRDHLSEQEATDVKHKLAQV